MHEPDETSDRELRERLRALRVDPPDAGFGAALRQRLLEAGPPAAEPAWRRLLPRAAPLRWAWPLAGALAGAAAFLALGALRGAPPPLPAHGATAELTEVPASKVAVVRLELTADVAVADADLRVTLPDGLVFWSDGRALAARSFAWRQPLTQGRNELPIAVRGTRPGVYRLRLTAHVGETSVEHDVTLAVVDG